MSREELDRELDRLRAATEDLAPARGLADAVVEAAAGAGVGAAGDPLAGIARATADLAPGAAFTDAVMREVSAVRPRRAQGSWLEGVARTGPVAIGVAVVAAAASFLLFLSSEGELDKAAVSAFDSVEVME